MRDPSILVLDENSVWSDDPAKKNAEHIIIKNGARSLGKGFAECDKLVSIEIPPSVRDLGWGTFMKCTSLVRVKIPKGVRKIGWWVFWGCTSLTEVEIPEGVTEIGSAAFLGCVNLTHIKIPSSVTCVKGMAFSWAGCIDQVIYDYPRLIRHYDLFQVKVQDLIRRFKENPEETQYYDLAHQLNGREWVSLLLEFPYLANRCPWKKLAPLNWARLLIRHPQFAEICPWKKMIGSYMPRLLGHRPELARWCVWEDLTVPCMVKLLARLPHFSKNCDWGRFHEVTRRGIVSSWDREDLISNFKLEYLSTAREFMQIWEYKLYNAYCYRDLAPGGLFSKEIDDAATYLIYKAMDKENARLYLNDQYCERNWTFLEELCGISPEELLEVPEKSQIPAFLALASPDSLFYSFFGAVKCRELDTFGNSPLFPALVHDLCSGSRNRYDFLLERGYDPDAKNLVGFSCNEVIASLGKNCFQPPRKIPIPRSGL